MQQAWQYEQRTGLLCSPVGSLIGHGYSGHGPGLNNPLSEAEANVGPIPRGLWQIVTWHDHYKDKGPIVAQLAPVNFNPHDRSGFLIHGDNEHGNFTASEGCIILGPEIRAKLRKSPTQYVRVI